MPETSTQSIRYDAGRDELSDEISEGLQDYYEQKFPPKPQEVQEFENTIAKDPLTRPEFEKDVGQFMGEYLDTFLEVSAPYEIQISEDSEQVIDALIDKVGLTNEDLGNLGVNYAIQETDRGKKLVEIGSFGSNRLLSDSRAADTILPLAYAKENIRLDTKDKFKDTSTEIPQRYYHKKLGRYLCKNDFGMHTWDPSEETLKGPDVTNLDAFLTAMRKELVRIGRNISDLSYSNYKKRLSELHGESLENETQTISPRVWSEVKEEISERIRKNPKEKELILRSVPKDDVIYKLPNHYQKLANIYGFITKDPVADYENFDKGDKERLSWILRSPYEEEKEGVDLDFLHYNLYDRPFLIPDGFDQKRFINNAISGVRDILAENAISANPEIKGIFENVWKCRRGYNSPYYYGADKVYDLFNEVGFDKTEGILQGEDRDIFNKLQALDFLKSMNFDIKGMELEEINKNLYEVIKLEQAGIFKYFENREKPLIDKLQSGSMKEKHWLEVVGSQKARDLFEEGKYMYWIGQQLFYNSIDRDQLPEHWSFRKEVLYGEQYWNKYDISNLEMSKDRIHEIIGKDFRILGPIMRSYGGDENLFEVLIKTLDRGEKINGIAIAYDKHKYVEGLLEDYYELDIAFALKDWPEELLGVLSKREIVIYYLSAVDYMPTYPEGLVGYAQWKLKRSGTYWDEIFSEDVEEKSDLDFRLSLSSQNDEITEFYKDAAEHVGNDVFQKYFLKFNPTRELNGNIPDYHDALYWLPNIKKFEAGDARSILNSISTHEENNLLRRLISVYEREEDELADTPIQSLRELKKRVVAIEEKIRFRDIPDQLWDLTLAPGFDIVSLKRMVKKEKFLDLMAGEYDKTQPFMPYSRLFSGRPLTEAISEGLGSRRQGIRGTAKNPTKLFHDLGELLKESNAKGGSIKVLDLLKEVPLDLERDIIHLLQEQEVDIGPTIEATVHAKSDSTAWACGNYTDCCMDFGTNKNDDYMFNSATQYFTIKYNGRIVAQSVIVDSTDKNGGDVIVLDNIEVANNYRHLSPYLAGVYEKFWTEYTDKPVKIGTGYSDLIPASACLENNTYKHKTRLVYSDSRGGRVYNLPKIDKGVGIKRDITIGNISERDIDFIAQMEREAYPKEIRQGKEHFAEILEKQRELEVPGAASSFYVFKSGKPAGYTILLPEESEVNSGEEVVHIYDMAVLPEYRGTEVASTMLNRVLDSAQAYGMSLELEARASTSYPVLKSKRMRDIFESKGFYLTHTEKLDKYLGEEDSYFLRFEYRGGEIA